MPAATALAGTRQEISTELLTCSFGSGGAGSFGAGFVATRGLNFSQTKGVFISFVGLLRTVEHGLHGAAIAASVTGGRTMNTSLWSSQAPSRLLASRHRVTGDLVFPPVSAHSPLAEQYDAVVLAGEGWIYSYTIINPSPKSGLQPFALGYVDMPGPVRLFGRVNGPRRPEIGDVCRVLPDDTFGYVFELVEDAQ